MVNIGETQTLEERIKILTEGAKYDVSCSSSNSARVAQKGQLGACHIAGVCHSFTADGRCISLIKLLMTNKCEFDCLYCVNRRSNDTPRASLTPREVCELIMGFYRRNYIEGLFLSSAVEKSPDHTMQLIIQTLTMLRKEYKFNGYIHIKAIPGASAHLIDLAATFADRMSVNIELPSETSLKLLAPQKKKEMLVSPMRQLSGVALSNAHTPRRLVKKIPAGQTTQMIIGASPDADGQIIRLTEALYRKFGLKRVYYSAYTPVNNDSRLPALPPDLRRENRLYQADWLLRFYGFDADELVPADRNFALDVDPKCDWALRNIDLFPVEINTASYDMLLRVPGIGVRNAFRIMQARKHSVLTFDSLKKMRVALTRALFFVTAAGEYRGIGDKPDLIRLRLTDKLPLLQNNNAPRQLSIFDNDIASVLSERNERNGLGDGKTGFGAGGYGAGAPSLSEFSEAALGGGDNPLLEYKADKARQSESFETLF
ncbi:MAG: putative DNA modification/repair radical SAM protein [Firmicutes bacterium]|nr:putative DNA modification/repair radical SAM protein [Bacillota bacterium]